MGEGGVKSPEKLPTSFMDGPYWKTSSLQPKLLLKQLILSILQFLSLSFEAYLVICSLSTLDT